jgi:hypothetical protein
VVGLGAVIIFPPACSLSHFIPGLSLFSDLSKILRKFSLSHYIPISEYTPINLLYFHFSMKTFHNLPLDLPVQIRFPLRRLLYSSFVAGIDTKNTFPRIKAPLSRLLLKHTWLPCLKYTLTLSSSRRANKFRD